MSRSTLATVTYPFLFTLPRDEHHPVAAVFQESPDGGAYVWLTAAGYLPESPQAYFEQENARTPRFLQAMGHAVACYVHDENGHTTAYRAPATTPDVYLKAPSFMPTKAFARRAFTCCFKVSGSPQDQEARWRRLAAELPADAGFELHLTCPDGTTERLQPDPAGPGQESAYRVRRLRVSVR